MTEPVDERTVFVFELGWSKPPATDTKLIIARDSVQAALQFNPRPTKVEQIMEVELAEGLHLVEHVLTPVAEPKPVFEIKTTVAKHRGKSYGQALHHAYMSGLPLITIKNVFMREVMGTIDALKALRNNMYRYRDGAPNALQDLADPPVGHYRKDAHWGAVEINLIKTRREAGDSFEQIGYIIGRHHVDVMERHNELTKVTAPPKRAKMADPHTDEAVYRAYVRGLSLENILATRVTETTMHALLVRLRKIVYVRRHDHDEAVGAKNEGSPANGPYRGDAAWSWYEHALIRTRVTAGDSFTQAAFILGRTDRDVETQYLTFSDPPVEETDEKPAPMPANTPSVPVYDQLLYNAYTSGHSLQDILEDASDVTDTIPELLVWLRTVVHTFRIDLVGRPRKVPGGNYRAGEPWSAAEKAYVVTRTEAGDSDEQMGIVLGRTRLSVRAIRHVIRHKDDDKVVETPATPASPPTPVKEPRRPKLIGTSKVSPLLKAYFSESKIGLKAILELFPEHGTREKLLVQLHKEVFAMRGDVPDKFPENPEFGFLYRNRASISPFEKSLVDHRRAAGDRDKDIAPVIGRALKFSASWKTRTLTSKNINPWFEHNDANMLEAYRLGMLVEDVAMVCERSKESVICRTFNLLEKNLVPPDVVEALDKLNFSSFPRYPKLGR